jgi:hypothetical protein
MENIHLIPTDKPTGIFESKNGLHFSIIEKIRYGEFKGFHIYITNDEEIKEGDWFVQVNTKKIIKHHPKNGLLLQPQSFDKKIILTTDPDLIKDGVQEIDEEYLEWFVKNPSCERVEVDTYSKKIGVETDTNGYREMDVFGKDYKIIIPQEEPKQETLEEVAERESQLGEYDRSFESTRKNYFIKGAKWQQERMYSKEEVEVIAKDAYAMGRNNILIGVFNKWFEQFKKK